MLRNVLTKINKFWIFISSDYNILLQNSMNKKDGKEKKKSIKDMDVPIPFDKMSTMHWFRQRVQYSEQLINEEQAKEGLQSDIFNGVRVYFDGHTDMISIIHLKKLVLSHGGTHSHYKSTSCTHIIGTALSLTKVEHMEHHARQKPNLRKKIHRPFYVHPNWILESCRQMVRLNEKDFQLFQSISSNSGDITKYLISESSNIVDNSVLKKRQYGLADYSKMNEIDEYQLVSHLKKKRMEIDGNYCQENENLEKEDEFVDFYKPRFSSLDFMKKTTSSTTIVQQPIDVNQDKEEEEEEEEEEQHVSTIQLTPPTTFFKKIPRGQSKELW
ncbi:hypothetical protein PPL_07233 [Heterostelium album PN500]|uniref:BRCT domain-containing protein n=1 Tax=Heterostelium pallidum (strain ATCC 26659 / Pp 5 / PN500) TaxID=670386 RepID=D3BER8_HETP5|nr:hypothetical protein PPL_07233 [Heterostelium album PN500]EFA80399.1 hypothetical protein PPL_07233 [Heterostelium album PN500]|eukprot:XP_020432519.1 hypothetical protein PPL_07233 [Heterostelium album PN500]